MWRRLRIAKVAVDRRGAADDLREVRETPHAAERRDDLPSERPIHPKGPSIHRWLPLQHGVTSTAQLAGSTLRDVADTQSRKAGQEVLVSRLVITIDAHVANPFFSAATAGVWRTFSASVARARDKRWRSASGLTPHTTAASAGVKPGGPTSSTPSRYCGESVDGARSPRRSSSPADAKSNGEGHGAGDGHSVSSSGTKDSSKSASRRWLQYRLRATVKSHGPRRVSGSSLVAWRTSLSHVSSSRSSASARFLVIRSRKANTLGRYASYTSSNAPVSPALSRATSTCSSSGAMVS